MNHGCGESAPVCDAKLFQPKVASAASSKRPQNTSHRAAEGDGFVTRQELNDALAKQAQTHSDQQKQQTCDLMTALTDVIKKTVSDMQKPHTTTQDHPAPYLHTVVRGADERDAEGERDYMRDAYGDEPRDAAFTADYYAPSYRMDYMRDAYGEERDAPAYDERDGYGEERDAPAYEERDADGERDAPGYEERDGEGECDAYGEERDAEGERDASAFEERDAEVEA